LSNDQITHLPNQLGQWVVESFDKLI